MPLSDLQKVFDKTGSTDFANHIALRSRRLDYLQSSEEIFDKTIYSILDSGAYHHIRQIESALDVLSATIDTYRYSAAFRIKHPVPLREFLTDRDLVTNLSLDPQITTGTEAYENHRKCLAFGRVVTKEYETTAFQWATEIGPWDRVVEAGRATWGEQWAFTTLAVTASGIRSTSEKCHDHGDLFDNSRSLCQRARFARLKSGAPVWWKGEFKRAKTGHDLLFLCMLSTPQHSRSELAAY
jgi:hypothetical protein